MDDQRLISFKFTQEKTMDIGVRVQNLSDIGIEDLKTIDCVVTPLKRSSYYDAPFGI